MPKVYVGNLASSVTSHDLQTLFSRAGEVRGALAVSDRTSGLCRGFGFVDMASAESAQAAIDGLNGVSVDGRAIVVTVARPREDRGSSGADSSTGYRATNRPDVGYGTGGYGGGRY